MSKTVTISDDLAELLDERRKQRGFASIDEAAEALIAQSLIMDDPEDDHSGGYTTDELRALIDEADADGEEVEWDPATFRQEILRRYAQRAKRT